MTLRFEESLMIFNTTADHKASRSSSMTRNKALCGKVLGPADPRDVSYTQTSRRGDRHIVHNSREQLTTSSAAIQAQVVPSLGIPVSSRTIQRRLAEGHLGSRRPLCVLPLMPNHRRHRLEWCRDRENWTAAEWNQVVFSDESRFNLSSGDNRVRVWKPVVNASILTLLYSDTLLPQLVKFCNAKKGGNRLVPGSEYMVDASKLPNQDSRVSGESLLSCVAWCCPDGTQHLFCLPILAMSGQSLASNGPVVYSRHLNLVFGHKEGTHNKLFLSSPTKYTIEPSRPLVLVWPPFELLH
ncbi:transposable element Tcb2 transposase [Trichonephila clavipes]|nr:transposable element Tcb2 transposase [Trichonephila clavipes]